MKIFVIINEIFTDMSVHPSKQGGLLLTVAGHRYTIHRKNKHTIRWRCYNRKCSASVFTFAFGDFAVLEGKGRKTHSHPPPEAGDLWQNLLMQYTNHKMIFLYLHMFKVLKSNLVRNILIRIIQLFNIGNLEIYIGLQFRGVIFNWPVSEWVPTVQIQKYNKTENRTDLKVG